MPFRNPQWTSGAVYPLRVRRIGRFGENLTDLMDEKMNGAYDNTGVVTKHGMQHGYVVFEAGDFSGDAGLKAVSFDTASDGVRFSSAPLVWLTYSGYSGGTGDPIDGYGPSINRSNEIPNVSSVTTSGFNLRLDDDKGQNIGFTNLGLAVYWVAIGPVAGI